MTPGRLPSGPSPSWFTLGFQGLKANVGKLRVSPASWHLTLPHGASPFPSLSPPTLKHPLTLSASLTTTLPVSKPWIKARAATMARVIWERRKKVRKTIVLSCQSRSGPRDYTTGMSSGE